MSAFFPPPIDGSATTNPADDFTRIPQLPPHFTDTSPPSSSTTSSSLSSSIIIVIIIIASAIIVTVCIYLLLQFLSRRFHRSFRTFTAADDVVVRRNSSSDGDQFHVASNHLLGSLPLFTFGSVSGNLVGGDCAVCLSKFEPHDQLRLLPLCCHAFHSACVDTWIISNQTCPLCRSTVFPSDSDVLDKILQTENRGTSGNRFRDGNSGSFRIEIGSISRRRGSATAEAVEGAGRSYSIGSFEYIVNGDGYEVSVGSTTHRRGVSDCASVDKESSVGIPAAEQHGEVLAAEVGSGRNWLRDYVGRLASSSRALSFRGSGRFFTGSSRRNDSVVAAEDLEANRAGEEISELFRWLSG